MKKTTKKVLALGSGAVLLVSASVMGTMAFLTFKTDVVTNTFTVGKVKIDLDEAKVNEYGTIVEGKDRVKANEYKLIPGHTYVKDPTVTVDANSEKSYVRMIVTVNNYTKVKEVFGDSFLPQNYVTGWDNAIWKSTENVKVDENDDTATYEFRYKEVVDVETTTDQDANISGIQLEPLFKEIVIPGNVTGEGLATLVGEDGKFNIEVVAHAIQADGFNDADAAWAAWTN